MNSNVSKKTDNRSKKFLPFIASSFLGGFALTYRMTEAIPFWAYGRVTEDFLIARLYSLFGDYQFDMIVASVLVGCLIILAKEKCARYIKGIFLPLFFSVIIVLGRSAITLGNLSAVFGAVPSVIRAGLATAGFTVMLRYLFAFFEAGLEKVKSINSVPGIFTALFGKSIFRNVFILLELLWLPIMILNYPGNYNADFIGQLLQNTGGMPYSTHHPIVLTWIIGIFFGCFKYIFGNYDIALFVWIVLQSAALSAALSLTLSELQRRDAPYGMLMAVLLVYVLSPIYSNIATTAIKDVPFAAACIWYCILVIRFYEDEKAFIGNKKNLIQVLAAAFLVCMCRNNGSIIIFVNGIIMSVYGMKKNNGNPDGRTGVSVVAAIKKALLLIIIPLGLYTALSSGIATAKNAESDGLKEIMSIPIQQTSLYLTRYEDELTDEEIENINALFVNYEAMIENYDPTISDTVKQFYDTDASSETVKNYLKTWASMFFKHPGTYFESFFLSAYGWFDPEVDTSVRYEGDSELFPRTGLFEGADELLIFFYRYIDRISFFGMLQSPGLWTMIMLILIRKYKGSAHLYAMQLISLLVCMAGPCFLKHPRYAFPIMFTIPFMLGYEVARNSSAETGADISLSSTEGN